MPPSGRRSLRTSGEGSFRRHPTPRAVSLGQTSRPASSEGSSSPACALQPGPGPACLRSSLPSAQGWGCVTASEGLEHLPAGPGWEPRWVLPGSATPDPALWQPVVCPATPGAPATIALPRCALGTCPLSLHVEDNLLTLPRDLGGIRPQKSLRESCCGPPAPNPQGPGGGYHRPLSRTGSEARWGGQASCRGLELASAHPVSAPAPPVGKVAFPSSAR